MKIYRLTTYKNVLRILISPLYHGKIGQSTKSRSKLPQKEKKTAAAVFSSLSDILFSLAVSESVALGALCEPFSAHVNADRELIPLWLEFGVAIGANEGRIHQNKVACNRNNCYRDRDDVPRSVIGFTKPVDLAGGEGERRQKSKYKQ
jgi:hypothetical protein